MSELPKGWTATKLKETTLTRKGKKPQQLKATSDTGFVPYLDIRAIETNEIRQFADVRSSRIATKNDVLMVWDGARSGWVGLGKEGAIGSTIMALESLCGDPRYLYYFLQSSFDELNSNTRGTGIPHVDPDIYNGLLVPVAPLNEQRRIVAKLETLLGKVDACQQRLAKFPRLLKRFRQAVLAAACSGRLTADWREERTLVDRLPRTVDTQDYPYEIPSSWEWVRLETACSKITDGEHLTPPLSEAGIPLLSAKDVRDTYLDFTDTKFVDEEVAQKSRSRCNPEFDDILVVSRGATVGRTCRVDIDRVFCLMGSVLLFKPVSSLVCSKWLEYCFKSPFGIETLLSTSSSSAQQAIYIRDMKSFPLPLPGIVEQQEIVRRVEAFFRLADQLEARYHKAKAYVDKLTQSLLAKAFRGELVPQDPNDEPAAVLLERIRAERAAQAKPAAKTATRAAKARK